MAKVNPIEQFVGKNGEGTYFPICNNCKHNNGDLTCKAFPDGILNGILDGKLDHTLPIEGDREIVFESKE